MGFELIDAIAVEWLHDRVVRVTFDTGEIRDVDLEPLLWGPAFADIQEDDRAFSQLCVDPEAGTIVWPSGTDISADTLYRLGRPAGQTQTG